MDEVVRFITSRQLGILLNRGAFSSIISYMDTDGETVIEIFDNDEYEFLEESIDYDEYDK